MPPLIPSPGSRWDGPAANESSPYNGRGEGTCIHPQLARGMCRCFLRRVSTNKSPPELIPKGCCKVKLLPPTPLPSFLFALGGKNLLRLARPSLLGIDRAKDRANFFALVAAPLSG